MSYLFCLHKLFLRLLADAALIIEFHNKQHKQHSESSFTHKLY